LSTLTVVNTRTTPYIVDGEGHLLAGGERGQVDDTEPRVQRALDAGILLTVDDQTPAAAATVSQQPAAQTDEVKA
jgi:hypothetical protein